MSNFNAAEVKDKLIQWLKEWEKENAHGCNFVLGISGGKDSTVVAALLKECFGAYRVYGVLMPCGIQKDINVSRDVVKTLGIKSIELDIGNAVDEVLSSILYGIYDNTRQGFDTLEISNQTKTNLPCRIRMATLYAIAQSINGRVIGTCNLSENYIGYFTRYGDGASDCEPLANLTVQEVKAIGYELGLPKEFIEKTPDDGLPCSIPDEEKLGFSYEVLDKYIRTGEIEDILVKEKIDKMHVKNKFKLEPMPSFKMQ